MEDTEATPWVVLGLGNPGARYRATRHNLGFAVVDRLAERGGERLPARPSPGAPAVFGEVRRGGRGIGLAKPWTWMNRSGTAARAACARWRVGADRLLVVFDDADLDLGILRIRKGGGAGGHNGLRSLIDELETAAFPRVRLGIRGTRRPQGSLADYVLEPFDDDERDRADALVELAADAVELVARDGLDRAMNEFNGRRAGEAEAERESTPDAPEGAHPIVRSNGNDGISC